MSENSFKVCGACKYTWRTIDDFINDKAVKVLWLQVIPGHPDANCIIFEHRNCGSTISVLTFKLRHLLSRKFTYTDDLYGTSECNDFCNTRDTMAACEKECVNAQDRELARLLVTLKWE
ncbi:hypothetical protein B6I21_02280 [candidate division KSB1 bacterium 4572_119]|nr:MAG: hypothetical protein B6I21_02280 [candidate division KSB1 bacterium 4572_119]